MVARKKVERVVSISIDDCSGEKVLEPVKSDKYQRLMVMLDKSSNTKLTRMCQKSGLSRSIIVQYLIDTVKLGDFDQAVREKRMKARPVGRAKKSFH